jgi:hypothetical protein
MRRRPAMPAAHHNTLTNLEVGRYAGDRLSVQPSCSTPCDIRVARNVVFSSACATYGAPECLPLKEDAAHTKLVIGRMLKDAEAATGSHTRRCTSRGWRRSRW